MLLPKAQACGRSLGPNPLGSRSRQPCLCAFAFAPGDQHPNVRRKLVQGLAACAAGPGRGPPCRNGNGRKLPFSFADRLKQGRALGAVGQAKGSVFNVAALIDPAIGAQQRRAHRIAGIGGIAPLHGGTCQRQQSFVADLRCFLPAHTHGAENFFFHGAHLLFLILHHVVIAHQVAQPCTSK